MHTEQHGAAGRERRLDEAIAAYLQAAEAGSGPCRSEWLARHPDLADGLVRFFEGEDGLDRVVAPLRAAGGSADQAESGRLGDYRILREVGRGGMGVVYEAEQVSLGRRVALKVLPFAATMDPRQLQRFHNEARAAASLHHEHIVPVYAVGCERGVHYYAMQFIDGQSLAELIARQALPGSNDVTTPYAKAAPGADTKPRAADATGPAPRDAAHSRRVAEWGVQAAEALEHAHSLGVVHRDVKPGNLLLDGAGKLWVADFGLARTAADSNLTMSGDVLGTLRYMSPEQALARHGLVDHRTDVYALGATLYELLTGRPAVEGKDRAEVLHNIAFAEPRAPRALDRAVPADLETVVLKAMSKEPADRYASAKELANDLRRFLEDRPVQARRPGLGRRVARLARRHRAVAATAAVGLMLALAVLAGSAGWVANDRAVRRDLAEERILEALEVAEVGLAEGNPHAPDLVAAGRRLEAQLDGGLVRGELRGRAERALADLAMLAELERARLEGGSFDADRIDHTPKLEAYARAFRAYGIDVGAQALEVDEAAAAIRERTIAIHLAVALDDWAHSRNTRLTDTAKRQRRDYLSAVAAGADIDPWRGRLRKALPSNDWAALQRLAREAPVDGLPAASLVLLGRSLSSRGMYREAVELLGRAQRRHPADLWVTHELAFALAELKPPRLADATAFGRAAVALRPRSPMVHVNLGVVLAEQGKLAEAVACYKEAIRLRPDFAIAHDNLGGALQKQGKAAEAIACFKEAIRLRPDFASAYNNLGATLAEQGKLAEAVAWCKEAIRLKPDFAGAHQNLGLVLWKQGKVDEAVACCKEAIRLQPDLAGAHHNLGLVLWKQGKVDEAVACYKEAIRLQPDLAEAHSNLGLVLAEQGKLGEAVARCKEAVRLQPDSALAHYNLGVVLAEQGKLAEAVACYKEAIRLQPDHAKAHNNLGVVLEKQGKPAEAVACYKEAIRLKPDLAEAHSNLGLVLAEQGKLGEAVARCKEAVRLQPDSALAHYNLGVVLAEQGKLAEAVACYKEAIRLQPDHAKAHYNLGVVLEKQGKPAEAIASYKEAIRLKPDHADAHLNLSAALKDKGRLDEAIASSKEAIRLKPGFAEAHVNLGVALAEQGKPAEAIACYKEAIRLKPDLAEAHNNLSAALKDKGRLDEAIASSKEAIRLKPDYAHAHYNLGVALREQGKWAEAVACHKEAIRLQPGFAQAHNNLGVALREQGRFTEALAAFRRAHELKVKQTGLQSPSPQWVKACERLVRLDRKLAAVLKGELRPADAAEAAELAELCLVYKKRPAAAAGLYLDAFAGDPKLAEDRDREHRYNAACAAALAGSGQGNDASALDAKERARLRARALTWLRDELAAWRRLLKKEPDKKSRAALLKTMRHWQSDPDFASVRGSGALKKLPEAELRQWRGLWEEVEALRKEAAGPG